VTSTRRIPSIEQLRQRPAVAQLEARFGRHVVVDALRVEAGRVRNALARGTTIVDVTDEIERGVAASLEREAAPSLRPVINATGVIIHTNLGRAPLGAAAAARVVEIAAGYSNLEYDLEEGARGRRDVHAERFICRLTGAEAACVVNNNAAATLITLAALASGREVIVSRGELVEIGGGFRIPDVMAQSGAILREVGTTNRTRVADFGAAINERTAAILRVHPSNFRIEGFTERPSVAELARLSKRFNLPLIEDAGSGYLQPPGSDGSVTGPLRDEPSIGATIEAGVDLITFSGDKLFGGPQAGIIAGKAELIQTIRCHPLMRALRVDKMTYAALEATLQAYNANRLLEVPVRHMIAAPLEGIGDRAMRLVEALKSSQISANVVDGVSTVGGGSAPGSAIPTRLVRLTLNSLSATALEDRLRTLDPPIIARIQDDHVVIDLRTVLPHQDATVTELLQRLS
jgi:L-seryl-tRNA(Ser) seleniumtransferase